MPIEKKKKEKEKQGGNVSNRMKGGQCGGVKWLE